MCTEWAVDHARESINELLVLWDIQNLNRLKILDSIEKDIENVNTQEHSLDNHAKSIGLIGLWSNTTIIDIKNTIKADLDLHDQKALSMVFQLMFIQLDMAKNIYDFLSRR